MPDLQVRWRVSEKLRNTSSSEFRTELHGSATSPDIIGRRRAAHSPRQPCARLMAKGSMLGEVLAAAGKSPPPPGSLWQKRSRAPRQEGTGPPGVGGLSSSSLAPPLLTRCGWSLGGMESFRSGLSLNAQETSSPSPSTSSRRISNWPTGQS